MRTLLLVVVLALPLAARADLLADATGSDAAVAGTVEDRIRLVMLHRLEEDPAALAGDVQVFARLDDERRAADRPRTGLTDDARYLAAGVAPTRDARVAALHAVLDAHPDPVVRRLAEHALETDDAEAADKLLADDRHNRRAAVINDAVRPLGIFSGLSFLAALNPILLAGSAVDSVATTAVNLWHYNRLSSPEREALARYRTQLERDPTTRDAPEIARAIRRLGKKRAEAICASTIALGTQALDAHDVEHALFYLGSAQKLDGCADDAGKPLQRAEELRARQAAEDDAGRWPVDDAPQPRPGLVQIDYDALAVATASGDPGAMIEAASRFREQHPETRFDDTARYVVAVARDLGGHHAEARAALDDVAGDDTGIARHARAVLASADFSPLDALRAAERRHRRDTLRYVFLGGRMDGRTAVYGGTQVAAAGVSAAESLGIFNVIGVASRAWQTWRKDPVQNQDIIDRGEAMLARDPDSSDAPVVHEKLADAYERAGSWGRALMHLKATPDPSEKRVAKLESKLADDLLKDAQQDDDNPFLLQTIAERFGKTKAAEKARERLKDRKTGDETVLPREVLEATPSLLGPTALDLEPTLLDGDPKNGELADRGVTLRDGTLKLTLRDDSESHEHDETRTLTPDAYARARAAAHEALYAKLLTADRRDPETGRFERYIPIFLQGEVGDTGGVYVYPGVKMRRYQSEDPKLYE